jgi:hypothetical protein
MQGDAEAKARFLRGVKAVMPVRDVICDDDEVGTGATGAGSKRKRKLIE